MKVSPNEVFSRTFKKGFFGYSEDEVEEFLQDVGEDYEKAYRENLELKERLLTLQDQLDKYSDIEAALSGTLLLAQSTADQAKGNATKEAELIIQNAEMIAASMVKEAENQVLEIHKKSEFAQHEYEVFKTRVQSLIEMMDRVIKNVGSEHL